MKKMIITYILIASLTGSCVPAYAAESATASDDGETANSIQSTSDLSSELNTDDMPDENLLSENTLSSVADEAAALDEESGYMDEVLDATTGLTMADLYSAISSSMLSNGEVSLSECLSAMGGINTTFDDIYSLAESGIDTSTVDMGLLNYSYDNLSDSLLNTYNSIDLSGMSVGCMQLFNDTYGDVISSLNFQAASIPSGFDINSMLNSAASAISSTYNSATNSGTFADVKNSISIGSVFNEAANGAATVSSLYNSGVSSAASNYDSYRNDSYGYLRSNYTTLANSIQADYDSYKSSSWAMDKMSQFLNSSGALYQIDSNGNVLFNDDVLSEMFESTYGTTKDNYQGSPVEEAETLVTSSIHSISDLWNNFVDTWNNFVDTGHTVAGNFMANVGEVVDLFTFWGNGDVDPSAGYSAKWGNYWDERRKEKRNNSN